MASWVGEYNVDLLVEEVLLVELNAVKATGLRLCRLLNFGNPRREIERIVHGLRSGLHLGALACISYLILR